VLQLCAAAAVVVQFVLQLQLILNFPPFHDDVMTPPDFRNSMAEKILKKVLDR